MAKKKQTKKVIKPAKDIVASMAGDFRKKMLELTEKGFKEITIDLASVKMVDSVGLGVLIATHNTLNKAEGKLTVKNASEDIYRLFKTMRLDQHFTVEQTA